MQYRKKKRGQRVDQTGRSIPKKSFVMLEKYMLNSLAYRSLSCNARALYIEFKLRYNGGNNGELSMSVREACASIGRKSTNTVDPTLKELQEKGFIRPHTLGAFTRKFRHATTWILTEYEFAGKPATKDFMRWRPGDKNQKPVSYFEESVSESGSKTT